jgi:hypothetical protein
MQSGRCVHCMSLILCIFIQSIHQAANALSKIQFMTNVETPGAET